MAGRIAFLLYLIVGILACRNDNKPDNSVKVTRDVIFQSVIEHYKLANDSLGLLSAQFLIANMGRKFASNGKSGLIAWDTTTVQADYLIYNIDNALQMSRSRIMDGTLKLSDFYEYVLPYRLNHEQVLPWRAKCIKLFHEVFLSSNSNNLDKVLAVNNNLREGFIFSYTGLHASSQSWQELMKHKKGDCWAMNSLVIFPLRAYGIPATIDFVPRWGNTNGGNHAWTVVFDKQGKTYPFMGCESTKWGYDPFGIYREKRLAPKIFRKTFSTDDELNLRSFADTMNIPAGLIFEGIRDVTDQYVKTQDVMIESDTLVNHKVVYLCTFSGGDWKPVFWSRVKGSKSKFRKMGLGILYLAAVYNRGVWQYIGQPFYLDESTGRKIDSRVNGIAEDIKIRYTQSKEFDEQAVYAMSLPSEKFYSTMDSVHVDLKRSKPVGNEQYSLFKWNNGWVFHSTSKASNGGNLIFKDASAGTLYRLFNTQAKGTERVFIYEGGKQKWF